MEQPVYGRLASLCLDKSKKGPEGHSIPYTANTRENRDLDLSKETKANHDPRKVTLGNQTLLLRTRQEPLPMLGSTFAFPNQKGFHDSMNAIWRNSPRNHGRVLVPSFRCDSQNGFRILVSVEKFASSKQGVGMLGLDKAVEKAPFDTKVMT